MNGDSFIAPCSLAIKQCTKKFSHSVASSELKLNSSFRNFASENCNANYSDERNCWHIAHSAQRLEYVVKGWQNYFQRVLIDKIAFL